MVLGPVEVEKTSDRLYFLVEDDCSYVWTPRTPDFTKKRVRYGDLKLESRERERARSMGGVWSTKARLRLGLAPGSFGRRRWLKNRSTVVAQDGRLRSRVGADGRLLHSWPPPPPVGKRMIDEVGKRMIDEDDP
ncbi:hypothetical protein E3N88_26038 [Mikania micrantha]|uniref:Uncharacterized protein n=1 Tax=Mikania micrantha TaxID=192012 RepID=A0A5N6N6F7_9ASTR|nr:hypothetical protein E3N88_26038 [Mikania micrantha]